LLFVAPQTSLFDADDGGEEEAFGEALAAAVDGDGCKNPMLAKNTASDKAGSARFTREKFVGG